MMIKSNMCSISMIVGVNNKWDTKCPERDMKCPEGEPQIINSSNINSSATGPLGDDHVSSGREPINNVNINKLVFNIESINQPASYNEIIKKDRNIKPFFDTFKKLKADDKPNICLVDCTRLVENQENVYAGLVENYNKDFAVLMWNTNGVKMYHHSLENNIMQIKRKNISCNKYYSKININEALQFMYDNGGINVFPRIIIIAGVEKLSTPESDAIYRSCSHHWNITDMYYIPTWIAPVHEIKTEICRLAGFSYGSHRLFLHTTSPVANAFAISYVNVVARPSEYIPSKLTGKSTISDGELAPSEVGQSPSKVNDAGEGGINEDVGDMGEKEYNRLNKMFQKWAKANTKIAKLVKSIDPDKIYSEEEFKKKCKISGITDMGKIMNETRGNSNGFGKLIRKNINDNVASLGMGGTYQLYPCLVSCYKLFFV